MPLVNMKDMLHHAYENAYAVGSFNIIGLEFLEGVLHAAERARAPVILGISEPHFGHYDAELLLPAAEAAARRAEVPVAIHFDHGSSAESIQRAIALGCNGVMIDASHSPLDENLKLTRQVVEMAHACGVPVEAELGYVPEAAGGAADALSFTTVDQARGFVRHTEVDFLAVSIGTVHGKLKGKPRLDYQRLRHINEALHIPLVIHGGSGLSEDQYHRLITGGVAKINYHTSLSEAAVKKVRSQNKSVSDFATLTGEVREAIATEAEQCMRSWGSAGRAAEVISQCRGWSPAEQTILFNLEMGEPEDVSMLLNRGRRLLETVPGVREVSAVHTLEESAGYRFIWRILLASTEAAKSLVSSTQYRDFKQRLLGSISSDRQTVLYQDVGSEVPASEPAQRTVNWR